MTNGQLFRMDHLNGREEELRQLFNLIAELVMENVNHINGAFASFSMEFSSFGESKGIPVVGIRNTYCECGTRARIMISESERNPNRLYATCAKFPKCNYYVWLTPRGFGGREPGNEDSNNSEQFLVDNINFAVLEARVAKIESMLGWVKMCITFVMFVVVCSSICDVLQVSCTFCDVKAEAFCGSNVFKSSTTKMMIRWKNIKHLEPPNYWHREVEYGMMNRVLLLQQLLPPFHVEQLLPFLVPFPVQLSFSVPWSEASQSTGHVQK
ncbi:sister chromatid cohesion protein PDS5-like protein [Senna tora]|uniref:Sister chromatid cohesion protein PDS5-like protein n=1 Tax=Senna tora TaxID=362788 RepID=A0A834TTD0_9FABA|nr:sister chromatid cohesion protein PDS5-like protein [Senna tora]